MSLRQRLGLGKLVYRFYHVPKGFVLRCINEGPINLWRTARGRAAMERAASTLKPMPCGDAAAPTVMFLTGSYYWYQTAFCAVSLLKHAGIPIQVEIYDDGTLTPEQCATLRRCLPGVRILLETEILAHLEQHLPESRFPTLRARRTIHPLMRKLTDIHAGRSGWRMFLDSDMLFFDRPHEVVEWLKSPQRPCYLVDVMNSYGYSQALMAELAETTILDRVNSGLYGLRSETIDWDRLEFWCREMLAREGTHYFQEQALTAVVLSRQQAVPLPEARYQLCPVPSEVEHPTAALHHYVAKSKASYFRVAWERAGLI